MRTELTPPPRHLHHPSDGQSVSNDSPNDAKLPSSTQKENPALIAEDGVFKLAAAGWGYCGGTRKSLPV